MALDYHTFEEIQTVHNRASNNKYRIFIPDCPDAGKMSDLHVRCTKCPLPLGEEVNVNEVILNWRNFLYEVYAFNVCMGQDKEKAI